MIVVHQFKPSKGEDADIAPLGERTLGAGESIPTDSVWLDLFEPTGEEIKAAEAFAGISLPTPEEMDEIEPSELLYTEDGGRFMTARVLCLAKTNRPKITNVSFIRKGRVLITVRYDDPKPFQSFSGHAQRFGLSRKDPDAIFVGLVDMIVGRASQILRTTGDRIDTLSDAVFERASRRGRPVTDEYQSVLATLGQEGSRIPRRCARASSRSSSCCALRARQLWEARRRANLKAISGRCCTTSPPSTRRPNISSAKCSSFSTAYSAS